MTDFWTKIEANLREMEADEEYDLFAIGYVIPQVTLAEEQWEEGDDPHETLINYISRCVRDDNLEARDVELIEQVLTAAIP